MNAKQFIRQCRTELGLKFYEWKERDGNIMKPGMQGCIDIVTLRSKGRDDFKHCRLLVYHLKLPGYALWGRTWSEVYEKLKYHTEKWKQEAAQKGKQSHDNPNHSQGHGG